MENRLANLKKLLQKYSFDAVLISSVPNIIYLTGYANFSTEEREAFLFITAKESYILTDARYTTEVKNHVKNFRIHKISSDYRFKQAFENLCKIHNVKSLGIEENDLRVSEYQTIKSITKIIKNFSPSVLRVKKSPEEIKKIEKACRLGDDAFEFILPKIKQGVTEKELAWELEKFIKQNDGDISFSPIVAFGANAAVPHHATGNWKLETGNFVLIDFGVKIDNYCSDMTRTVFFGKANTEQRKMYQVVYDSQKTAVENLKSLILNHESIHAATIDKAARDYIINQSYPPIPHSLGHGIGLQVHEAPTLSPNSKHTLQEGMVFSIEPGIYIPNFGGVRIEDLFVIQNGKLKQITNSPKTFIEI